MPTPQLVQETREVLSMLHQFAPASIGRESELGTQLSFKEAIPFAEKIVDLYKRIPIVSLDDLTDNQLATIKTLGTQDIEQLRLIMSFDAISVGDAAQRRTGLIAYLKARRDQMFEQLLPFVSYGIARATNTSVMEADAKAAMDEIKEQANRLAGELKKSQEEANEALAAIRAVAAEQGVSQQATYFRDETDIQNTFAAAWLKKAYWSAALVVSFAVLTLFLNKTDFFHTTTTGEAIQFVTSKALIFAVLAYMLFTSVKNYVSHKHNAVVNRHRQNALLTYQALVKAAGTTGTEDIVLAHAAACIFAPQETGFTHRSSEGSPHSSSVLELMTKSSRIAP